MGYLVNNYNDKFGNIHPECYVRIIQLDIHYQGRAVYIHLGFFKDESSRKENKNPVFKKTVQFFDTDFDMFLGFMADHNNPTLHSMYKLMGEVVPELEGAEMVIEEEKLPGGEKGVELSADVISRIEKLAKEYMNDGMNQDDAYAQAQKDILDAGREAVEGKVKEGVESAEEFNGLEDIISEDFLSEEAKEKKELNKA